MTAIPTIHVSMDSSPLQDALRSIRLFTKWPKKPIDELCPGARLFHVRPGQMVIKQGEVLDGLYGVVSGRVEVGSAQPDGRRYIRRYGEPGQISGFLCMFDGKGSPYSYIAYEPTSIVFVERAVFLAVLSRQPDLWLSVVSELSSVQRATLAAIEEQIFETARLRVARALLSLTKTYGVLKDNHSSLGIRLTQDDLGSLVGVSRQSVNKELKRFEQEGLIRIEYGRFVISNRSAMEKIISGPGDSSHTAV